MAKCWAGDTALQVAPRMPVPVERFMRDAKIMQVYEGTNQIRRVIIARRPPRGLSPSSSGLAAPGRQLTRVTGRNACEMSGASNGEPSKRAIRCAARGAADPTTTGRRNANLDVPGGRRSIARRVPRRSR
jgi:hypothetical protein